MPVVFTKSAYKTPQAVTNIGQGHNTITLPVWMVVGNIKRQLDSSTDNCEALARVVQTALLRMIHDYDQLVESEGDATQDALDLAVDILEARDVLAQAYGVTL